MDDFSQIVKDGVLQKLDVKKVHINSVTHTVIQILEEDSNLLSTDIILDESDYLYVDEFGRNLHVSTTTNRWLKWRQKHPEIKKISFHALRHTYCSLMLTYGIDPRTLADLMGHSTPIISLNTYSHSYMETKQTYVNSLNDALYASVK